MEDETKITIGTVNSQRHRGETLADTITVTKGEQALQIKGLSEDKLGEFTVDYFDHAGQALGWAVQDGFVVQENLDATGWINPETEKLATQKSFGVIKPGAARSYKFTQEFSQAIADLAT